MLKKIVYGPRRPGPLEVNPADGEPRIDDHGQSRHLEPVISAGAGRLATMPRLACGHEDDPVEIEGIGNGSRGSQVPEVDRIEGAAHDPDALRGHVGFGQVPR